MAVLAAGMEEAVIPAVLAGMALAATGTVGAGIVLVLAGMGVTGTAVTGMAGVVAGIMVVAVPAGELAPR